MRISNQTCLKLRFLRITTRLAATRVKHVPNEADHHAGAAQSRKRKQLDVGAKVLAACDRKRKNENKARHKKKKIANKSAI